MKETAPSNHGRSHLARGAVPVIVHPLPLSSPPVVSDAAKSCRGPKKKGKIHSPVAVLIQLELLKWSGKGFTVVAAAAVAMDACLEELDRQRSLPTPIEPELEKLLKEDFNKSNLRRVCKNKDAKAYKPLGVAWEDLDPSDVVLVERAQELAQLSGYPTLVHDLVKKIVLCVKLSSTSPQFYNQNAVASPHAAAAAGAAAVECGPVGDKEKDCEDSRGLIKAILPCRIEDFGFRVGSVGATVAGLEEGSTSGCQEVKLDVAMTSAEESDSATSGNRALPAHLQPLGPVEDDLTSVLYVSAQYMDAW